MSTDSNHRDKRQREAEGMDAAESVELFRNGMARLDAARKELALAQANMMDVRLQIRSAGYYEPDSLMCLSDGGDEHVLSHVMNFLTVEEAGKCEMVCKSFRSSLVSRYWEKWDESVLSKVSRRSPSARNARERAIRYHLASSLAKRIGGIGEGISKHIFDSYLDSNRDDMIDRRVYDCCEGCSAFPEELDFRVLRRNVANDFELFVRFSRTRDNYLFGEGFLPFELLDELEMNLRTIDFSESWPQLVEVTRLAKNYNEEVPPLNDSLLEECMRQLTVTVIAVDKNTSNVSLVIAQTDFSGAGSRTAGIDNMGDHGVCWPQGQLSLHSHGEINVRRERAGLGGDFYSSSNTEPSAALGMLFTNVTWRDPNNRVIDKQCEWSLQIRSYVPRND